MRAQREEKYKDWVPRPLQSHACAVTAHVTLIYIYIAAFRQS